MIRLRSTFRPLLALLVVSGLIFGVTSCFKAIQDHLAPNPTTLSLVQGPPFASNLKSPIGLAEDPKGNIWVTEAGSGTANDGQVSVIVGGTKYPVVTGFVSAMSPENSPEGLNHLAYKDGKLYILHATTDLLYMVDVSGFVPGVSAPIAAGSLTTVNIGEFVLSREPDLNTPEDSNPYNLTFGPNGDLFIVDAGANAIIRYNLTTMALSVYATFPDITTTPKPFSGDVVPTGIVYDGTKFWVSSLTGAPFHPGIATIYQVTPNGATGTVSSYKTGFTGLTDIALTPGGKPIVTEFGFGPPPPADPTGRVANGEDPTQSLLPAIPTPVDILPSIEADTYYILYYGPGLIFKLKGSN